MNGFFVFALLTSVVFQSPAIPEPAATPPESSPIPSPPGWKGSTRPQPSSSVSPEVPRRSHPRLGGFAGVVIRPTAIGRDFGLLLGGGGGLTYDRYFFGGAGYTLMASTTRRTWGTWGDLGIDPGGPRPQLPLRSQLDLEYGGLFFGVSALRRGNVDLSAKVFAGIGRACVDLDEVYNCHLLTPIFVGEPELLVYFHLARVFRLGLSAGYRFVATGEWPGPRNFELAGPHGSLLLEFGWF